MSGILSGFTGGGGAVAANYIEDVFSTYLYTGTGATQTINNGIDLAGKGGLVWAKSRTSTNNNGLYDSARGFQNVLNSASTNPQQNYGSSTISSVSSTGFSIGADIDINSSGNSFASWTLRKQPKFFDIATFTQSSSSITFTHNLGSTPGCVIIKSTSVSEVWHVWHSGLNAGVNSTSYQIVLSSVNPPTNTGAVWITPTSTDCTVNTNALTVGVTYVAYLFASNAGGFGLTGNDNVITCGLFTTNGSGNYTVNLGYEPQFLLLRDIDQPNSWIIRDTMRGLYATSGGVQLNPNASAAETNMSTPTTYINSTGFSGVGNITRNYIYIAIRRGPMKVPTVGTSVFSPNASSASAGTALVTNFPVDLSIPTVRTGDGKYESDRLRGVNSPGLTANQPYLIINNTLSEQTNTNLASGWDNTQILIPTYYGGASNIWWNFRRAPSFFDVVCYTGTGNVGADATRITHNLGVAPELIIVKGRTNAVGWPVYSQTTGVNNYLLVNTTDATAALTGIWATTAPTTTTFGVSNGGGSFNNGGGVAYVAYLFATCPGVSKVGSYTGTGATQTINCGFTGGARFVLIKRSDSTGDWYVWDTARGMVSGTDPSLSLNTIAAEVNANSVYTTGVGFQIVSTAAGINASGGTYIYLAIA